MYIYIYILLNIYGKIEYHVYMQYRLHGCMYMNYQRNIMVDGDNFGLFTTENPAKTQRKPSGQQGTGHRYHLSGR